MVWNKSGAFKLYRLFLTLRNCQPRPIRRKPRRQPLLLHAPGLVSACGACAGQVQGPAPKSLIHFVHGLHQANAVFRHVGFQIKRELLPGGGLQVHQHHARFRVAVAGSVDVFQDSARGLRDVGAVAGWAGQGDAGTAAVLGVFFAVRAGADEGHDVASVAVLPAQFFGCAAREFGDRFLQVLQFGDGVAEAPRARDLLFGRGLVFKFNAGHAVEFAHGFFQHHRPTGFRRCRVHALQVQRGVHALRSQLGADAGANAPHIVHFGGLQKGGQFLRVARAQVADLRMVRGVAAWLALSALGDRVGQLGQGLSRADANANACRDADPLMNAPADDAGAPHQVTGNAAHIDEAFIDAVDLLRVAQACGQSHHAVAHVAIQREVGRQGDESGFFFQVPDLEPRCAHLDAQRFGFVASRNRAAVVVAQHDYRAGFQPGLKHALAAAIKVVAIDQGEHVMCRAGRCWRPLRPTPRWSGLRWARCRQSPGLPRPGGSCRGRSAGSCR